MQMQRVLKEICVEEEWEQRVRNQSDIWSLILIYESLWVPY